MRVAVTGEGDSAERLAQLLESAGTVPVPLPCIEIVPADDETLAAARTAAADADWVVVTSTRTVPIVWPDGIAISTPFAVVGPATAAAVERAGGHVGIVGNGGGRELGLQLAPAVSGRRVFCPLAAGAGTALEEALDDAGATVVQLDVYEAHPIGPDDTPVDAAVFSSPSAVAGWLKTRTLDELPVVAAIGTTTAAALAAHGREPEVVPAVPGFGHLAVALADHLRRSAS